MLDWHSCQICYPLEIKILLLLLLLLRYTSPNEHFEYGYLYSNALFNIYSSKAQHFAPN